jgi:hypothetical protein
LPVLPLGLDDLDLLRAETMNVIQPKSYRITLDGDISLRGAEIDGQDSHPHAPRAGSVR